MNNPHPVVIANLKLGYRKPLFDGLHFTLQNKEFVTIMGENGSGKTSLMEALMGYMKPESGSISYFGKNLQDQNRVTLNQSLGWVTSHREEYPSHLTVENLFTALRPIYPNWNSKLVSSLTKHFILDTRKKLMHLSLGESSKVKLIKALAIMPKLLILDELTANLSEDSKNVLQGTLMDLFFSGDMSVLYFAHSTEEAMRLSDRIYTLSSSGLTGIRE